MHCSVNLLIKCSLFYSIQQGLAPLYIFWRPSGLRALTTMNQWFKLSIWFGTCVCFVHKTTTNTLLTKKVIVQESNICKILLAITFIGYPWFTNSFWRVTIWTKHSSNQCIARLLQMTWCVMRKRVQGRFSFVCITFHHDMTRILFCNGKNAHSLS